MVNFSTEIKNMTYKAEKSLVLIGDSEIPTAQLLRGVFEYEGYAVVIAESAEEIFALISERRPDLVILETYLGKDSGFDILRRLREDESTAAIPTFLLTTNVDWPDILHALELGADDTMRKPVHPRELLARAESKITARRLREALQQRTDSLEAILRASEILNGQHDRSRLPELVLSLLDDLLPLKAVSLITIQIGIKRGSTINAHPKIAQKTIKQWLQTSGNRIRLLSDVADLSGLVLNDYTGHALVMPLSYLDGGDEKAYLVAFTDKPLDTKQVQLMTGIGRQADLALRNADLYQFQASYAQQLEIKVAERTKELQSTQNQLIQAEKLATVGRLAAGIAHEINNPLLPIKINLESILEDIELGSEVEADIVTATLESVDRIQRLVQRLLEYNAGHTAAPETMQPLDINEVVENMCELTRKSFIQTGKQIVLNLQPVPYVLANRDTMTQVFINLALNAAEAMESGGVLTITTQVSGDGLAQIVFKDTGLGIPSEMIDRIFDPFVTTKPSGSGLGLFVSYGIIEGHHGMITVSSQVGKGTTFMVSLPVAPLSDTMMLT